MYQYFTTRAVKNLTLIDEQESMGPLLDLKVADLTGEQTPQIYAVITSVFIIKYSGLWPRCKIKFENIASRPCSI